MLTDLCQSLQGRIQIPNIHMPKTIPFYGIRLFKITPQPTRNRDAFSRSSTQALPSENSKLDLKQQSYTCKLYMRYSNIFRLRSLFYMLRHTTLYGRGLINLSRCYCIRIIFNRHRPMSFSISIAVISAFIKSCKTTCPIKSLWRYSSIYLDILWIAARYQAPGLSPACFKVIFRHSSYISRFQAIIHISSRQISFRHSYRIKALVQLFLFH